MVPSIIDVWGSPPPPTGLLCGLLKETTAGLEQRLGGSVKAVREWDRMLAKARYICNTLT